MTRTQAIAYITEKLAALEDDRVLAVARIIETMDLAADLPRDLTADELALIEKSREDFKEGRTYALDEARAITDRALSKFGVPPSRT